VAHAKKSGEPVDLAIVLGGGPKSMGGKKPPALDEAEGDSDELPPGFEAAASEFLDDKMPHEGRMHALKRAIHACMEDYE
jgi:hypothetical protein